MRRKFRGSICRTGSEVALSHRWLHKDAATPRMISGARMFQTDFFEALALELAIIEELVQVGTCTFDDLRGRLPSYAWREVFATVDRLRRAGTVSLQRADSFGSLVSLAPDGSESACRVVFRHSTTPI